MSDPFFDADRMSGLYPEKGKGPSIKLPCGAIGYWDETGYRCLTCLSIYGSVSCPCITSEPEE